MSDFIGITIFMNSGWRRCCQICQDFRRSSQVQAGSGREDDFEAHKRHPQPLERHLRRQIQVRHSPQHQSQGKSIGTSIQGQRHCLSSRYSFLNWLVKLNCITKKVSLHNWFLTLFMLFHLKFCHFCWRRLTTTSFTELTKKITSMKLANLVTR